MIPKIVVVDIGSWLVESSKGGADGCHRAPLRVALERALSTKLSTELLAAWHRHGHSMGLLRHASLWMALPEQDILLLSNGFELVAVDGAKHFLGHVLLMLKAFQQGFAVLTVGIVWLGSL